MLTFYKSPLTKKQMMLYLEKELEYSNKILAESR